LSGSLVGGGWARGFDVAVCRGGDEGGRAANARFMTSLGIFEDSRLCTSDRMRLVTWISTACSPISTRGKQSPAWVFKHGFVFRDEYLIPVCTPLFVDIRLLVQPSK
jgi:hypothetical protein